MVSAPFINTILCQTCIKIYKIELTFVSFIFSHLFSQSLDCNPGSKGPTTGLEECITCDKGQHQTAPGKNECTECLEGKYMSEVGAVICLDCLPGTIGDLKKQSSCLDCLPGQYRDGSQTDLTTCVPCNLGEYQIEHGTTFW